MQQEIGLQYAKDKSIDKSGFLADARLHQSKYRALQLNVPFDRYGNYLTKADAVIGLNFYHDFDVFSEVKKRYPNYSKQLYANMLRSEHIGFNLFVPFKSDYGFCKNVLNQLLSHQIKSIDTIKIEYAPSPASNYLNDKTSFDVYLSYTHVDDKKGIIGIEVKYTEQAYKLKKDSKEADYVNDKNSRYYSITKQCQLYQPEAIDLLGTDKFRQIWRNQLLGESILIADKAQFQHFTSLTIFPAGNFHFKETSKDYIDLLSNNNDRFVGVTYEDFIATCWNFQPNERFGKWVNYLKKRYIW